MKPSRGTERGDWFVGLQEAFVDYHIRNVSDRYDFDSVRVGIQPFEQFALGRQVGFKAAVIVKMVLRQVAEHGCRKA